MVIGDVESREPAAVVWRRRRQDPNHCNLWNGCCVASHLTQTKILSWNETRQNLMKVLAFSAFPPKHGRKIPKPTRSRDIPKLRIHRVVYFSHKYVGAGQESSLCPKCKITRNSWDNLASLDNTSYEIPMIIIFFFLTKKVRPTINVMLSSENFRRVCATLFSTNYRRTKNIKNTCDNVYALQPRSEDDVFEAL